MCRAVRQGRTNRDGDAVDRFHRDIMKCVEVVGDAVPSLRSEEYALQVFTVTLAVHLNAALERCFDAGYITPSQAQLLLRPVVEQLTAAPTSSDPLRTG